MLSLSLKSITSLTEWQRRVKKETRKRKLDNDLQTTQLFSPGISCAAIFDKWMKSFPARKVTTGYYLGFMLLQRIRVNPVLALCPALDQAFRFYSCNAEKGYLNKLRDLLTQFSSVHSCNPFLHNWWILPSLQLSLLSCLLTKRVTENMNNGVH